MELIINGSVVPERRIYRWNVSTSGGSLDSLVSSTGKTSNPIIHINADWVTYNVQGGITNEEEMGSFTIPAYNGVTARSTTISISWEDDVPRIISVRQSGKGYATYPIWKDVYYTSSDSALTYQIVSGGEVLFSGRAIKTPNKPLMINVSRICQNYLNNDIQELIENRDDFIYVENACRRFDLMDGDLLLQSYYFINDWSYDERATDDLSHPINGHHAFNMFEPLSYIINNQLYVGLNEGEYYVPACGDYAVYYNNSYGGWDAFLIEGSVVQTDKITNHGVTKTYDNTKLDFGSQNYLNEISASYKCTTGLLNDSEAENLAKNLIPSTKIYLHDLKADKIIPVTMVTNSAEYKTYKNQGKKAVTYTFDLKSSQNKIRK